MNTRYVRLLVPSVLLLLMIACGPSPEQIATMTASAWTPTPVPPTVTPSPTPVPYDLTVSVVDATSAPIAGASITFPESGSGEAVAADAAGKYSWANLPGSTVTLNVTAQGYLPATQSATLERGPSAISVVMERDPYGLLPSTACAVGENLLYMEDFQDRQTDLGHGTSDGGKPTPLGSAVDEAGNTVLIHDPAQGGDVTTSLNANANGVFYEFGEAVWRMRFMMTQETNWSARWNSARPVEFGGITTSGSVYMINFNVNRHLYINRGIWDASGQRVFNLGNPGLLDMVFILEPNAWHYLEISTFQGRVQLWLDGESIADEVDGMPLPPGSFEIGGGDSGIMYFDAISVCELSAPFTSLPAPVPVPTP